MSPKPVRAKICAAATLCTAISFMGIMSTAALAESTIHSGDHLQIRVYNHSDLSTEVVTNSDGSAALPVAGNIELAGLTEQAAGRRVAAALKPYLKYPSVDVRITQQAQAIFFTGAYNGISVFTPGETLGSAVGNLTQRQVDANNANIFNATSVDMRNVRIERNGNVIPHIFNLEELSRSGLSGVALEPGDTIQLSTKPVQVQVRGTTKTPGPVYVYSGDSLGQAVAQAGGYDATTSYARILLLRDGATQTISSGSAVMSAPAQDGDIVILQPALHVDVLGSVQRPGDLLLHSGNTLYAAIYEAGGPATHADLTHVKVVHEGVAKDYNLSQVIHGDTSVNVALADGDTVVVPKGRGIDGTSVGGTAAFFSSVRYLFFP